MSTSLYWIRCEDHTDMFSQGYVGVSNNTEALTNRIYRNAKKYGYEVLG